MSDKNKEAIELFDKLGVSLYKIVSSLLHKKLHLAPNFHKELKTSLIGGLNDGSIQLSDLQKNEINSVVAMIDKIANLTGTDSHEYGWYEKVDALLKKKRVDTYAMGLHPDAKPDLKPIKDHVGGSHLSSNEQFKQKYLKYKAKYTNLKNLKIK